MKADAAEEIRIPLPPYAADILRGLNDAGYEGFLVGGCVRDALLGREPSDYDIATNALPEEVGAVFPKTVPTGIRFGTVTVLAGGHRAEVTTYRSESGYEDFRRPGSVRFERGILPDLSRRDFTVNAMAYGPETGLVDPFGGRGDLGRRLIRAVGVPEERFEEDALRILRAYRFAAQLGFEIEEATGRATAKRMPLTANLSGERIKVELDKLLLSGQPALVLELVRLGFFHGLGIEARVPDSLLFPPGLPDILSVRWSAFFILTGADLPALSERLRFDNGLKRDSAALIYELSLPVPGTPPDVKRRLSQIGEPLFRCSLALRKAVFGVDPGPVLERLDGIMKRREPYRVNMLAVDGKDLMEAGAKPGPELGEALSRLLALVLEHPELNQKAILLKEARKNGDL